MNFATKVPESSIDYLAIGSVHLLGLFIILDALTGWLLWFESFASTTAWAIVAAIPVLMLAFVFGLFSVSLTEFLFLSVLKTKDKGIAQLVQIASLKSELIAQEYLETIRIRRILLGSSLGFVTLVVGFCLQLNRQADNLKRGFYLIIAGLIFVAVACVVLAYYFNKQISQISQKAGAWAKRGDEGKNE